MQRLLQKLPAGETALAIFFLLIQTGSALYLPYLTAGIVDGGIMTGDIAHIWRQGGLMLLFACLSLVGALANMYIAGRLAFRFGQNLRGELYQKALRFSKQEYDKFGAASLITRNTNDVTQVQTLVEMGLKFLILCPLYLLGGILLTWRLSSQLALVFVGVIPVMAVAAVVIYRFASPLYAKMQGLLDRLNLLFREGLTGVRVIRAFAREEDDYQKYATANGHYTKTAITAGTIMSVFVPLITLFLNLAAVLIVWLGGNLAAAGRMELGAIMAAVSYSAQILIGFSLLTMVILSLPRGRVSLQRVYEVLDTPLSIEEAAQPAQPRVGALQFDGVGFRYPGAAKPTLQDISFTVQPGQTLAVIGSTGDGKTSLLNLIPRLYDVEQGAITIGGVDIRELAESDLRDLVSYAPQKSTLFMGSIRENMRIAQPDATDAEIWRALETAQAAEFVRKLPQGLEAPVEKGGANFSGGQKQRLCIARALLKQAQVYLFDDSFSALDFKTDALVREGMAEQLREAVTVIVAQRVSTILSADLIAVLEKGNLVGLGTHEKLMRDNPVYQEIVESQLGKEVAA